MKLIHQIILHIVNVLAICFITYYILDIYNPMMKFIDNDVSKTLLLIFGVTALIGNQMTLWKQMKEPAQRKNGHGKSMVGETTQGKTMTNFQKKKKSQREDDGLLEEQIEEL